MSPARRASVGLEQADQERFPRSQRVLLERALAAEHAAEPLTARALYRELLERQPSDDVYASACLFRWIGRTYMQQGDMALAQEHYEASLAIAERAGSARGTAMALNLLAIARQLTGHPEEAEALYARIVALADESDDQELAAMAHQNLGNIACMQGELRAALRHFRRSLRAYQAAGLAHQTGGLWNNVGMLHTDMGRWDEAKAAFRRAERSCRLGGDRTGSFSVRMNLAELSIARGDLESAATLCEEVFRESRSPEAGPWLGEAHKHYGVVCRERGQVERAERAFERAAEIAALRQDLLLAAETARERAELLVRQERNREALECLNRAHAHFTRLRAGRDLAELADRIGRFEERFLEIVRAWSTSLESRDRYTQGHCERVAELASRLAAALGFGEKALFWFRIGALLHDIGKLDVPLSVLNKDGPLTVAERELIEQHPAAGEQLLAHIAFPWDVLPMIRHHHERWDGHGYPDRLAGEQIPLTARILTIADVYDALTTTRSYRAAHTPLDALAIMRTMRGTTLEPELLDRFAALVEHEAHSPTWSALALAG